MIREWSNARMNILQNKFFKVVGSYTIFLGTFKKPLSFWPLYLKYGGDSYLAQRDTEFQGICILDYIEWMNKYNC